MKTATVRIESDKRTNDLLIKKLSDDVKLIKKYKKDMDQASWGYEEGVLISGNDALYLIQVLKEDNKRNV